MLATWSTQGYLDTDGGMLFIGPEAEQRFGHRHFMDLTAVFTAPPEFTVLHGRDEIGRTDPGAAHRPGGGSAAAATRRADLAGHLDRLEAAALLRRTRRGRRAGPLAVGGIGGLSFALARAMRDVLLGADLPVSLTRRASGVLAGLRSDAVGRVHPDGTVISRGEDDLRWWTWAGYRVNATLKATLGAVPTRRSGSTT